MKVPFGWLQEFIELPESAQQVAERLSLAGLEAAGVSEALAGLEELLVGQVTAVDPHPDADKLQVCQVDAGEDQKRQIVCGATNVYAGMKAAVILPGSRLPDGNRIRRAKLRGIESSGMLCSARELGLGDDHAGILNLDTTLAPGAPLVDALGGNESVIEIEITPNRGDALSILGVARDLSALYDRDLRPPPVAPVPAVIDDALRIELDAPQACPLFAGRLIRGIDPEARSPAWLRERLRRVGVRSLHPVVDVTQYVMLELGQPMHAYDVAKLSGGVRARWAHAGEKLQLLDGSEPVLDADMLVIADDERGLGLAGVMGGLQSSVQAETRDIFLESAFFTPASIQGRGRRLGLQTDAAYRFERGVDFTLQEKAIERATALILEIAGGRPGPTITARADKNLPSRSPIKLTRNKLASLLGFDTPNQSVQQILTRLDMHPAADKEGWSITPPPARFDVSIEEDVIEEVGRIYGYEHIPALHYPSAHAMTPEPEGEIALPRLKQVLVARGYQEVITYSFVDERLQRLVTGEGGIALANPISAEMSQLRTSLWPGLLEALRYNLNRQQDRVRIFECGMRFITQAEEIKQENVIAGLSIGSLVPEQWGRDSVAATFFDASSELDALAALGGARRLAMARDEHPALHPGRCARLNLAGEEIGWLGAIHPALAGKIGVPERTLLFELALAPLQAAEIPQMTEVSRFPSIRRDLALVLPEAVSAGNVTALIKEAGGEILRDTVVFDLYRGSELENDTKSLAIGLIFNHKSRTLTDEEIDDRVASIIAQLEQETDAKLRE